MKIQLQDVTKRFGDFYALDHINLTIQEGEFVALLGPSGSGKTTLLRTLAGLDSPDSGNLLFENQNIADMPTQDRQIGFIFQHYALFRHMTVFDNVAFGLDVLPKSHRPSKADIAEKVHALLKLVQLDWLADRFPAQLSGGQKQRIALARALAIEPKVLLLDEPFGALDTHIRKELRTWLRNLHNRLKMTSVFVTHDVDEALEVADKIVVMNHGKIVQIGTPEEIYRKPANAFVYQFIGDVNLFHGRMDGNTLTLVDPPDQQTPPTESQTIAAFVRSDAMRVSLTEPTNKTFVPAVIDTIKHLGHSVKIQAKSTTGQQLDIRLSDHDPITANLHPGQAVFVILDTQRMYFQDYQI
jgi:sulfate transport system ATP-binding protein